VPGAWDGFELTVRAVLGQQLEPERVGGVLLEQPDAVGSGALRGQREAEYVDVVRVVQGESADAADVLHRRQLERRRERVVARIGVDAVRQVVVDRVEHRDRVRIAARSMGRKGHRMAFAQESTDFFRGHLDVVLTGHAYLSSPGSMSRAEARTLTQSRRRRARASVDRVRKERWDAG